MEKQGWWEEILCMIQNSPRKIQVYEGIEEVSCPELYALGIDSKSALGAIVSHTSGICIDNWIRIIGQNSPERKGITLYNEQKMEDRVLMDGMLVVAQDIVGGIFSINQKKYDEGRNKIWYFAPDTLEWECMDVNYYEFLVWLIQGDIDKFYSNMRWDTWEKECQIVDFDRVILIYPFLWSKECDLRNATKKCVPYEELKGINFEYAKKFYY